MGAKRAVLAASVAAVVGLVPMAALARKGSNDPRPHDARDDRTRHVGDDHGGHGGDDRGGHH